jgi:hypothetical protein
VWPLCITTFRQKRHLNWCDVLSDCNSVMRGYMRPGASRQQPKGLCSLVPDGRGAALYGRRGSPASKVQMDSLTSDFVSTGAGRVPPIQSTQGNCPNAFSPMTAPITGFSATVAAIGVARFPATSPVPRSRSMMSCCKPLSRRARCRYGTGLPPTQLNMPAPAGPVHLPKGMTNRRGSPCETLSVAMLPSRRRQRDYPSNSRASTGRCGVWRYRPSPLTRRESAGVRTCDFSQLRAVTACAENAWRRELR